MMTRIERQTTSVRMGGLQVADWTTSGRCHQRATRGCHLRLISGETPDISTGDMGPGRCEAGSVWSVCVIEEWRGYTSTHVMIHTVEESTGMLERSDSDTGSEVWTDEMLVWVCRRHVVANIGGGTGL
ncbi:hypothetical protein Tco_1032811 [Tanacetum coccineum]|uniref:Uncharacterized protein n=1 Tax=Tanacetum coccineum TaxID=301880 RepID=A0ABQ5GDG8_9ASTR